MLKKKIWNGCDKSGQASLVFVIVIWDFLYSMC